MKDKKTNRVNSKLPVRVQCVRCGKLYHQKQKNQKYCCRQCFLDRNDLQFRRQFASKHAQYSTCRVLITKQIDVFEHLVPIVGAVYEAKIIDMEAYEHSAKPIVTIDGIPVILRDGEFVFVG